MGGRASFDLGARLVELCAHLSVTGQEAAIADALAVDYADEPLLRVGDSLVIGRPDDRPLVLLVGHLDVVPPTTADERPHVEQGSDGPIVIGRGTTDMKGGIVVAEALFRDGDLRTGSPYAMVLVLYAGEEGPEEGNQLAHVLSAVPWLKTAELAVVLEATDLEVHLGCLGGLHALLTFVGRQAHSARPWHGDNALTKGGALLTELHSRLPVEVKIDGIHYRDVLTATQAWTDNARNLVPGRFVVNLNYRFAPNRDLEEAEAELRAWVGDRAEVEIVDRSPPAPPQVAAPLVAAFTAAVAAPVAGKQAWTDVARFAAARVPALNYGPGLVGQSHQTGEYVPISNLEVAIDHLRRFLSTSS
ncbi:MAG: succinyl-diaminopimelate desuccinylase [Actinomycetota bacterium]|nr:succinyl-diaminopimelate desuccinylase [Actinomycetota bacterium]